MASAAFTLSNGIGLTGSIGVGKTAVANALKSRGWKVLSSDGLARKLVRPGEPALKEIQKAFGPAVMTSGDELDREKLAAIVFKSPEKRKILEKILHPRIRSHWLAEAGRLEKEGFSVAVDVPLLYETGAEKHFRHVVIVACSETSQRERLNQRGWTPEQISDRLAAQWTQQAKIDKADYVLWNNFSMEETECQLKRVLNDLSSMS